MSLNHNGDSISGIIWAQLEAAQRGVTTVWTIYDRLNGKTRRPQTPTLNAVGRVLGRRIGWVYVQ
jgi:hypothetical protein